MGGHRGGTVGGMVQAIPRTGWRKSCYDLRPVRTVLKLRRPPPDLSPIIGQAAENVL
jgi:hypothetical protein